MGAGVETALAIGAPRVVVGRVIPVLLGEVPVDLVEAAHEPAARAVPPVWAVVDGVVEAEAEEGDAK